MLVLATIAGLKFETTLDLFFLDNPEQTKERPRLVEELKKFGNARCAAPGYTAHCQLILVKE